MRRSSVLLAAALAAGLASPAFAAQHLIKANVDFAFKAGDQTLPAGRYEVRVADDPDEEVLTFRNVATGERTLVPYITRTSPRKDDQDVFVFDRIGDERLLSEIHLSDTDGFVLPGAEHRRHTHEEVKASAHEHG